MRFPWIGRKNRLVPAWKEEPCATSDFEGVVRHDCVLRTYGCGTMAVRKDFTWNLARPDGTFESNNKPIRKWWRTHAQPDKAK